MQMTYKSSSMMIRKITIEAIYWWGRTENYYHLYFRQLDKISEDEELLDFFVQKIFNNFLREYSIRRNITSGRNTPKELVCKLIQMGFVEDVKNGDMEVIDNISCRLKKESELANNGTTSLLSKVAFLINPSSYALYDSLSKRALWKKVKETKKGITQNYLTEYSNFINEIRYLEMRFEDEQLFEIAFEELKKYPDTISHDYFSSNKEAFRLRILDKYLWVYAFESEERIINNRGYKKFLKL